MLKPLRILVADDYRDTVESMESLLTDRGYDVRTAKDGLDALKLAIACRPDLLLLDLSMPSLDGWQVCRKVRQQPWGQGATIIAWTGWDSAESDLRSKEAGFDGHWVKPDVFDRLLSLLRAYKDRSPSEALRTVFLRALRQ